MPWKQIDILARHRLAQHGLTSITIAGLLCRQAELLYPGLFLAISVRKGVLHIQVEDTSLLLFKTIQGPLVQRLNVYALRCKLPLVESVRLTIVEGPARFMGTE